MRYRRSASSLAGPSVTATAPPHIGQRSYSACSADQFTSHAKQQYDTCASSGAARSGTILVLWSTPRPALIPRRHGPTIRPRPDATYRLPAPGGEALARPARLLPGGREVDLLRGVAQRDVGPQPRDQLEEPLLLGLRVVADDELRAWHRWQGGDRVVAAGHRQRTDVHPAGALTVLGPGVRTVGGGVAGDRALGVGDRLGVALLDPDLERLGVVGVPEERHRLPLQHDPDVDAVGDLADAHRAARAGVEIGPVRREDVVRSRWIGEGLRHGVEVWAVARADDR